MNTTLTYGQAIATIDHAIELFINGIEIPEKMVEDITFAVNNDLEVRDYLIGLPVDFDINISAGFLNELSESVTNAERFAYDTVNAMFHYELENMQACEMLLDLALDVNPEYNLTKLIKRVVQAGWPSSSFTTMRKELAGTVAESIEEKSDELLWILQ